MKKYKCSDREIYVFDASEMRKAMRNYRPMVVRDRKKEASRKQCRMLDIAGRSW